VGLTRYYHLKYQWLSNKVKANTKALAQKNANLLIQISGLLVTGTDAIVISFFLGLKMASVYAVYSLVFSTLYTFMWLFSGSATPSFGHFMVENNESALKKVFLEFADGFYILAFSVYVTAYLMITPFILLYTKGMTDVQYIMDYLPLLFVLIGVSNSIRIPSNNMINAGGYFEQTKYRSLTEAIINIVSSVILVQFIGIYGALLGTIISFLYRTIDILLFSNKYIVKGVLKEQSFMCILDMFTGVAFIIIVRKVFSFSLYSLSWGYFIAAASVYFICIIIVEICVNLIFRKKYLLPNINRLIRIFKGNE
jgi:O-antigen/teichoic acid export membrane protein